ncbi:hypothetical protein GGP41_008907 [Bipolaris sorokiniana]|uniref:Uncharacterized protein n=1 Tax=Cochliobolus sativus TaxID=45130 RepID=A0A8H5Z9I1_COCSA|nr:hypothetical protein GGP41_008907 [Bipolaris sorokiniana]
MEYDQATTRAEALEVSEVRNTKDIIRDFLDAVTKGKQKSAFAAGEASVLASDYYYVFPKKAPEWFKLNRMITRLVKHRIKFDNEL